MKGICTTLAAGLCLGVLATGSWADGAADMALPAGLSMAQPSTAGMDLATIKAMPGVDAAAIRAAKTAAGATAVRSGPSPDPLQDTPSTTLPPLAEGDFQRFVREATGQPLPLFGAELFNQAPSTYAPVQNIPVTPEYVVGPGDELLIRIWGAFDTEVRTVVDRSGQISLPKVGTFSVIGIRAAELERYIQGKVGRVFRNFEINVTLGQLRSMQVYVVGHARRPGTYTVSSLSTLINALFASGGPSATGSMRHIQLKRKGVPVAELDVYDFIRQGDNRADMRLQPGDVIVIPPAGPRVAVIGTVNTPAVYELKGTEATIAEVLDWGGGLPVTATTRMASLERIQPEAKTARSVASLSLDAAGQTARLKNGDLLKVYEISPKFENAVTLRGNVAAPTRYRFAEGMRIRDLIPEKEALVVRNYYQRTNQLIPGAGSGSLAGGADNISSRVRNTANEVNWDYATVERLNPDNLTTSILSFNLGKAVLEGDPAHDLELKSGDVVTIFSKNDLNIPVAKKTSLVNVEGEVQTAGVYQLRPGETLRQLLTRAGGLTPQAYVYGAEFTREQTRRQQQERLDQAVRQLERSLASESTRLFANVAGTSTDQAVMAQVLQQQQQQQQQQQLARLKTLKSNGRIALELPIKAAKITDLPDLPLEDGDRILIPPRSSYVMAVGAVNNDNALLWKPGRTVSDTLDLAGTTQAADLDNAFLFRADGTVIGRNQAGNWLFISSGFDGIELMPGDAVVVPEKLDRRTAWTAFVGGLKDWTQILYQMGLGIAAWKVIK